MIIEICDDDIHITSLRQLDNKLCAALADNAMSTAQINKTTSSFTNNRNSVLNRPFGISNSFHQNLNNLGDNYVSEARAFPYERLGQASIETSVPNQNYRSNSSCKIYQDLDEYKGHLV